MMCLQSVASTTLEALFYYIGSLKVFRTFLKEFLTRGGLCRSGTKGVAGLGVKKAGVCHNTYLDNWHWLWTVIAAIRPIV